MNDARQMPDTVTTAIVLFDGTCGLCDRSVQFILRHDRAKRFRFAPLQSEIGKQLLRENRVDPEQTDSLVLIETDRAYTKSTAVLKIALELNEPWPLAGLLGFLPIDWRDQAYDFIARHRHQWFKPQDACSVPTPGDRERFLV